ncbi:hypothetical protein AB1Y20_021317 [Prymnesium parvum]
MLSLSSTAGLSLAASPRAFQLLAKPLPFDFAQGTFVHGYQQLGQEPAVGPDDLAALAYGTGHLSVMLSHSPSSVASLQAVYPDQLEVPHWAMGPLREESTQDADMQLPPASSVTSSQLSLHGAASFIGMGGWAWDPNALHAEGLEPSGSEANLGDGEDLRPALVGSVSSMIIDEPVGYDGGLERFRLLDRLDGDVGSEVFGFHPVLGSSVSSLSDLSPDVVHAELQVGKLHRAELEDRDGEDLLPALEASSLVSSLALDAWDGLKGTDWTWGMKPGGGDLEAMRPVLGDLHSLASFQDQPANFPLFQAEDSVSLATSFVVGSMTSFPLGQMKASDEMDGLGMLSPQLDILPLPAVERPEDLQGPVGSEQNEAALSLSGSLEAVGSLGEMRSVVHRRRAESPLDDMLELDVNLLEPGKPTFIFPMQPSEDGGDLVRQSEMGVAAPALSIASSLAGLHSFTPMSSVGVDGEGMADVEKADKLDSYQWPLWSDELDYEPNIDMLRADRALEYHLPRDVRVDIAAISFGGSLAAVRSFTQSMVDMAPTSDDAAPVGAMTGTVGLQLQVNAGRWSSRKRNVDKIDFHDPSQAFFVNEEDILALRLASSLSSLTGSSFDALSFPEALDLHRAEQLGAYELPPIRAADNSHDGHLHWSHHNAQIENVPIEGFAVGTDGADIELNEKWHDALLGSRENVVHGRRDTSTTPPKVSEFAKQLLPLGVHPTQPDTLVGEISTEVLTETTDMSTLEMPTEDEILFGVAPTSLVSSYALMVEASSLGTSFRQEILSAPTLSVVVVSLTPSPPAVPPAPPFECFADSLLEGARPYIRGPSPGGTNLVLGNGSAYATSAGGIGSESTGSAFSRNLAGLYRFVSGTSGPVQIYMQTRQYLSRQLTATSEYPTSISIVLRTAQVMFRARFFERCVMKNAALSSSD